MQELILSGWPREGRGKGASRRLRLRGKIPAVMYGEGENLPLALDARQLRRLLSTEAGENALMRLEVEGDEGVNRMVMVRELQSDPVRGEILHADLLRISMDREIEVEVPIELKGEARGVTVDGGVLGQILRALSVSCLPNAIPKSIEADVSELGVGDVLHVGALKLPSAVTLLTNPEEAVANVTLVAEEKPAEVAEEEAAVEAAAGEAEEPKAEESKEVTAED